MSHQHRSLQQASFGIFGAVLIEDLLQGGAERDELPATGVAAMTATKSAPGSESVRRSESHLARSLAKLLVRFR